MRSTINRVGKYDLKAVLARTPTSTVYDGWDSDIARRVAVKMMPLSPADDDDGREALAKFKRGAQAAGQLNHPNIVAVYDYGETDDYAYLIMEFIDGPTLKDLFDKNERFGMPEICQIISGLLEALEYSHKHGVVHRDIKPANIMFTQDRKIKVTDFGIARLENSEMTQAGMVIGTPAYMSPEQFLGEKIDLRTDIYSTGVVLYHLLTGERPYEGNLATIMHKVLYGLPPVPSRVSTMVTPALDKVVTRAMARNREDRYSSAAQFNAAVQSTLSPPVEDHTRIAPSAARRLSPAPAPAKSRSGSSARSAIFGLVAVCLAAAGGGAVWYSYSKPTSVRVVEADKNEPGAPKQTASPPEAPISVADHSSPIDSNTRVPPNPIVSLPQSEPEPSAPVASPVSQYSDAGGRRKVRPILDVPVSVQHRIVRLSRRCRCHRRLQPIRHGWRSRPSRQRIDRQRLPWLQKGLAASRNRHAGVRTIKSHWLTRRSSSRPLTIRSTRDKTMMPAPVRCAGCGLNRAIRRRRRANPFCPLRSTRRHRSVQSGLCARRLHPTRRPIWVWTARKGWS